MNGQGISLEEIESGGQATLIFSLGLVLVFLVLAAQYESYVDPVIIMLSVPLAVLGALGAQILRGFSNDIYCQIGLVMLIGLASKNSILIVEFANQLRAEGLPIPKAALQAAQQRLRPILMTAISTLSSIFSPGGGLWRGRWQPSIPGNSRLWRHVYCHVLESICRSHFVHRH